MGTFELRDGKIAAWRDDFDMGLTTKMMSGEDVDAAVLPVIASAPVCPRTVRAPSRSAAT